VFGTGLEYGINKHWTARTEYRYTMYEKTEMAGTKFGADVQEVRAGLGYKF
jgi:opacity protein-like surface antigen